jgi:hypothetical protein
MAGMDEVGAHADIDSFFVHGMAQGFSFARQSGIDSSSGILFDLDSIHNAFLSGPLHEKIDFP